MPTVVLIDVSLSMARIVPSKNASHQTTRKELVQRGVLHLLQDLEKMHPMEQVCLIAFSSESYVVAPFTRDYSVLRSALYDIRLYDTTDLKKGLETARTAIINKFGTDTPTQIIVVTDGRPNGGDPAQVAFPFPVKLHIVAFGSRSDFDIDSLKRLATNKHGSFHFVEFPHGAKNFKFTFDKILSTHYAPYRGTLVMGHLFSHVTLSPDPTLSLFQQQWASEEDTPLFFPTTLSIIGFVATKKMTSPPSLSYHMLIPSLPPNPTLPDSADPSVPLAATAGGPTPSTTTTTPTATTAVPNMPPQQQGGPSMQQQPQPAVKIENIVAGGPSTSTPAVGSTTSTTTTTPPATTEETNAILSVSIANCLKNEKLAGIVKLGHNWYALVNYITNDDATIGGLGLFVLPPKLSLPDFGAWTAGDVMEAEPQTKGLKRKATTAIFSPYPTSFPVKKSLAKSYSAGKGVYTIPTVTTDVLQTDCSKLLRYVKGLPQKRELLYGECQKFRQLAISYYFPSLIESIVSLLEGELSTLKDKMSEPGLIIKDVIAQLRENDTSTPLHPRSTKMSVANLLN